MHFFLFNSFMIIDFILLNKITMIIIYFVENSKLNGKIHVNINMIKRNNN